MKDKFVIPYYSFVIGQNPDNKYDLIIDELSEGERLIVKTKSATHSGGNINHSLTSVFCDKLFKLDFDDITSLLEYHYDKYTGLKKDFIEYTIPIVTDCFEQSEKNKDYQRRMIFKKGLDWLQNKLGYSTSLKTKSELLYISPKLVKELGDLNNNSYDTTKIVIFLNEINSNYQNENILSVALLLRAFINHIPSIFNQGNFKSMLSHLPSSLKEGLVPLEDQLRKIADYHTHMTVKKKEFIPTFNQIEPFKASFELLVQEIIRKLK